MSTGPINRSTSPQSLPPEGPSQREMLRQRTNEIAQGALRNMSDLSLAVSEAAGKGYSEVVRFLLSEGRTISQEDLDEAVRIASLNGHLEVVRFLLSKGGTISQDKLGTAVLNAVANGHLEVVRFLLSEGRTISQCFLDMAVLSTAVEGHLEVVRFLLSDGRTISQEHLGLAVRFASFNDHFEIVRFLLSGGREIDQEDLGSIVMDAVENGHLEVVRFLLSEGGGIGRIALGRAVKAAAENGHLEVVRFLLSEGGGIGRIALGRAVKAAAVNGHLEVVRFLLSEGRTIDQEDLGLAVRVAFSLAAENGHLEVVRFLLSGGRTISPDGLGDAVKVAAKNGHPEVVRFLLSEDRTISREKLGSAVKVAAANGHLEVVRFLLSGGRTISPDGLGDAVKVAAKNGHPEVVRFLLSEDRTISPDDLGRAVLCAAVNGHLEFVRLLLSDGRTINQEHLALAVRNAADKGHLEIVRFLLSEDRTISQAYLEWAVLQASSRGHLACVEFLVSHGPIEESVRDSASTNASGTDRYRIRDILRAARTVPDQAAAVGSRGQYNFYVKFSEVMEYPENYLRFLEQQGPPAHIYVVEESGQISPAIDVGGITKQLVTSLCEAILAKYQLLCLNSQGIPAKTGNQPTHRQLGRLFSLVYEANINKTDKILTGYVVNERFLEIVRVVATADKEEADKEEKFQTVCKIIGELDPLLLPSINLILDPTLENANSYLESLQEKPLSEQDLDGVKRCQQEAKERFMPFYLAAEDFLAGTTDGFRDAILSTNLQELARSIQGEPLSVLGILQSLRLEPAGALPLRSQQIITTLASQDQAAIQELCVRLRQEQEEDVLSTSFADKINWLVAAIALKDPDKEEDKVWLNKFFFAVTGKKAMSAGMTLRLQETLRQDLVFEIHTCFNGLDLSAIELSRKDFLSALDLAINTEGYNIA